MDQNLILPPKKLEEHIVEKWEKDHKHEISLIFGDWFQNTSPLQAEFATATPFSNVVIKNFLSDEWAKKLETEFPKVDESFYLYQNPIE
jgi:hypothetical protein